MFKKIIKSAFLLLIPFLVNGQSAGSYKSGFKKEGNEISFSTTSTQVKLEFCAPGVFRVRASWSGKFEVNEQLMVSRYDWPIVPVQTIDKNDHFLLSTSSLNIKVYKAPFRIIVFDKTGKLLSEDEQTALLKQGDAVSANKKLAADEHFFGFGERMDFLDRRSKKVTLNVGRGKGLPHAIGAYNILEANYSPVPFFMSTRGYGIFFHNTFATEWDMGASKKDQYSFKAVDGELDYYFIYGPTFKTILGSYTDITGKSPMLPQFALGLHAGTYSGGTWSHEALTSDQYVVALAKKYRELGIPVDLLWLDSTWRLFGENGGKGATSFEWRETFKNPKSMFDSIYAMGYKMVGLHIRPRFDNAKKLNLLDQAREKGYTYPENGKPGEFVNFFDQKAVDWWWANGVKRVASIGAKFLKTDEGSAFGALANESEKVGPTGKDAERLHNVFPVAYAKAPFEEFQKFNGIRGLNQTREGYSGIQRYPYIFAGDWPSEWQYFAPVIKAGLNIGLSGVGSWAHCMGGFEHQADPELYIRWVQFGMFSPIATVFGMDHPGYKEPWKYGEDALRNFKKYDVLRYRMIPYLYTGMHQQYQSGVPMMRALVLDHQDDENVYEIADQYMLGDHLMVAPVTTKGAITRTVYLPKGTWFDYWTGKQYSGASYVNVVAPLDTIPLFVKGGGIIPMQPEMLYSGEKAIDLITLDIFPHGASAYNLYEDDGLSLNYQKGSSALTRITAAQSANALELTIAKPKGSFKPTFHTYLAKVHWNLANQPKAVIENGEGLKQLNNKADLEKSPGWYYDTAARLLWVKSKNGNTATMVIQIN
ncbi:Alpha-xylosidase [compost metagenome]